MTVMRSRLSDKVLPYISAAKVPPGVTVPAHTSCAWDSTYRLHHTARCLFTPVPGGTGERSSPRPAWQAVETAGSRGSGIPPGR